MGAGPFPHLPTYHRARSLSVSLLSLAVRPTSTGWPKGKDPDQSAQQR